MGSVTFGALGKHGWLGNQLFQIATTIATARDNDFDFYFPYSWEWKNRIRGVGRYCISIEEEMATILEEKFSYSSIPKLTRSTNLHGYFQSEKYFDRHKEYIKDIIEDDMVGINRLGLSDIKAIIGDTCFIHVRRGDYLNLQHIYSSLPISYYTKAIDMAKSRGFNKFAVLSDDISWCEQRFIGSEFKFFHGDQMEDLSIMAACTGAIMANSSFSWWGSYLGNKNFVIAPKVWFNASGPSDWYDLYREEWILV